MADRQTLKDRVKALFLSSITDIAPAAAGLEAASTPHQRSFSPFDPDDQDRQAALTFEVFEAFAKPEDPDDGLSAALDVLEGAATSGDMMMAQHVLGVFAAHASKVRVDTTSVPVPPLAFSAGEFEAIGDAPLAPADGEDAILSGEDLLHWFREDIHLNEHHRHWHMVYATSGIPSGTPAQPSLPVRMKKRQGEIFVYMHKQMLARYETERLAAGLERVAPFNDFTQSLGEGYDPNAREPKDLGYVARADGAMIQRPAQRDLNERRTAFRTFLQTGFVEGERIPITATTVGTALESNRALVATEFNTFAEYTKAAVLVRNLHLHNVGHGVIASAGEEGSGVMTNPHTSLKDPVFWRWHKMIDDLAEQYYQRQPAHDFSTSPITVAAPPDGGSAITVFSDTATPDVNFGEEDRSTLKQQLQIRAEAMFASGEHGADVLKTSLRRERYKYLGRFHGAGVPDREFERDTLFNERFAISLRVVSAAVAPATARLFLCADAFLDLDPTLSPQARRAIRAEEHRHWIEIDRQPVDLTAGEQTLVFPADESSVVRKLRGKAVWPTSAVTEEAFDALHNDAPGDRDDYCDCGWPLNLLLPKGQSGGMGFQLMAMVSEGAPAVSAGACGSRSFCGTDFDGYPELDDVDIGFPFDRPSPSGTLGMIARSPNMAIRPITIDHVDDLWSQIFPGV